MPKKMKTGLLFRQFPQIKNTKYNPGVSFSTYRVNPSIRIYMAPALVLPECPNFLGVSPKVLCHPTGEETRSKRLMRKCKATAGVQEGGEPFSRMPLDSQNQRKFNKKRKVSFSTLEEVELTRCSACEKIFDSETLLRIHKESCFQMLASNLDDISRKTNQQVKLCFMSQFGMMPVANKEGHTTRVLYSSDGGIEMDGKPSVLVARRKTSGRSLSSFFRSHYFIPLSGVRGQKLIRQSEKDFVSDPERAARGVDKVLSQNAATKFRTSCRKKRSGTNKVKMFAKENTYTHTYQFSKRDKIQRQTELIIGLRTSHFELLNKCKDLTVKLSHITADEIKTWVPDKPLPGKLPNRYRFTMKRCRVNIVDMCHSVEGRAHLQSIERAKRAAKRGENEL